MEAYSPYLIGNTGRQISITTSYSAIIRLFNTRIQLLFLNLDLDFSSAYTYQGIENDFYVFNTNGTSTTTLFPIDKIGYLYVDPDWEMWETSLAQGGEALGYLPEDAQNVTISTSYDEQGNLYILDYQFVVIHSSGNSTTTHHIEYDSESGVRVYTNFTSYNYPNIEGNNPIYVIETSTLMGKPEGTEVESPIRITIIPFMIAIAIRKKRNQ